MKQIISASLLMACALSFTNCQESAYDDKYNDPNKVTAVLMDKLMAGVFYKEKVVAIQNYDRYWSLDTQWLGKYAQSVGFYIDPRQYFNGYSVDNFYSSLYSAAANLKKMEEMYNEMSDAEKPQYEAYCLAAKVHVYRHLISVMDVYGDVPWHDACLVALHGDYSYSNASFEDDQELYKMVIEDLKAAGLRFGSEDFIIPRGFTATQDFINNADMSKWQKYANGLCLRAAMRVSTNGPLAEYGQSVVKEILENPSTYPLVENYEDNIAIKNLRADPVNDEGGGGMWQSDLCKIASGAIIRNMLSNYDKSTYSGTYQEGIDDPRLPLLYNKATPTGKLAGLTPDREIPSVYRGTDPEMDMAQESSYSVNTVGFSFARENGFFFYNQNWDHQQFSSSETWFIRAEARQRGWVSGDAKEAFKEGIKQSIRFFFKYQKNKSRADISVGDDGSDRRGYVDNPEEPTDAWIDEFAEARWETRIDGSTYDNANPRLDAIITQKWLSFNMMS